jgi:small-conductance mechanosensitive channel
MLNESYFGNTVHEWAAGAITAAVVFALLLTVRQLVKRRLKIFSKRTATRVDDLLVEVMGRTKYIFLIAFSLYAGSLNLTLSESARQILSIVVRLSILLQIGIWASATATFLLRGKRSEDGRQASRAAIVFSVKLVLWSVLALLALDNLGVNVTALITGLGIGGVAVALALQSVLGDLFASMSITLDEPFVPGDVIQVDALVGTVEQVGLKTTRMKSISGEQVIFANTDLLKSRIRNFGRMQERRVVFNVGVTFQTPHDVLERIPGMMKDIIQKRPGTRFDRAHFQKFGDSALVFEIVYFVTEPDYARYMDIQQAVNLDICSRFESEGIAFAYPTQTVFLHPQGPPPSPAA